jgi:hypothetical protein
MDQKPSLLVSVRWLTDLMCYRDDDDVSPVPLPRIESSQETLDDDNSA